MIFNIAGGVPAATQATPTISVNSAGLITASATQTAGYVVAGTKSATKQLTVQAAKTVTPSASAQTAVAASRFTTGAVKVAAIPSTYKRVATGTVTAALGDVSVTGLSFTPNHVYLIRSAPTLGSILCSIDNSIALAEKINGADWYEDIAITTTYSSGGFSVSVGSSKYEGTYYYVAWE